MSPLSVITLTAFATRLPRLLLFFFFNDTATTEISTLSLHDALPICENLHRLGAGKSHFKIARLLPDIFSDSNDDGVDFLAGGASWNPDAPPARKSTPSSLLDRKSTRLNSSHDQISYAVFCLKKKILIAESLGTEEELQAMRAQVDREIAEATDAALSAPFPSPESAPRHVYSETVDPTSDAFA